jgi:hypothetical protein
MFIFSCTAKKFWFMYFRKGIVKPQSQFHITFMCLRAIFILKRSVYLFSCSRIGKPIRGIYINRSQKHECRNWDCSHEDPLLAIYVSNFRYCLCSVRSGPHILRILFSWKVAFRFRAHRCCLGYPWKLNSKIVAVDICSCLVWFTFRLWHRVKVDSGRGLPMVHVLST